MKGKSNVVTIRVRSNIRYKEKKEKAYETPPFL